MNPDTGRRALSWLHEMRLLTDAEHTAAAGDPELGVVTLRTPAEALAWVVAREIVSTAQLADLPARAAAGRENEAQAIVSEATGLVSSELPLPPWAQFQLRLRERRMQDGVSADALDRLLALGLVDAVQHAHSLTMLPTHQAAWAAPDSLPATLAWTVLGSGALSDDDLAALAGRAGHADIVADAAARVAQARKPSRTATSFVTSTSSSASSSTSSTSAYFSKTTISVNTSPGLVPARWKMIGAVVAALVVLYVLFGR